jgi:hypothetical protein
VAAGGDLHGLHERPPGGPDPAHHLHRSGRQAQLVEGRSGPLEEDQRAQVGDGVATDERERRKRRPSSPRSDQGAPQRRRVSGMLPADRPARSPAALTVLDTATVADALGGRRGRRTLRRCRSALSRRKRRRGRHDRWRMSGPPIAPGSGAPCATTLAGRGRGSRSPLQREQAAPGHRPTHAPSSLHAGVTGTERGARQCDRRPRARRAAPRLPGGGLTAAWMAKGARTGVRGVQRDSTPQGRPRRPLVSRRTSRRRMGKVATTGGRAAQRCVATTPSTACS